MFILLRRYWRSSLFGFALVMLGEFCLHHPVSGQTGAVLASNTQKGYSTSNQGKACFHLYFFSQNNGALSADPHNTFFKRHVATGYWQAFKANFSETWTSPAIAVQGTSKLFHRRINTGTSEGEYNTVLNLKSVRLS